MEGEMIKYGLGLVQALVVHLYCLLTGAESNLLKLKGELELLKALLQDMSNKDDHRKDQRHRVWGRQILDVIREVEDVIDTCAFQSRKEKHSNFFRRTFSCLSKENIRLAELVKSLRKIKVKPLFEKDKHDFVAISVFDRPNRPERENTSVPSVQIPRQENVIPLQQEMDTIIHDLTDQSQKFGVSCIVGMPGLGKSTMAWNIYQDSRITDLFPTVIWVKIPQEFKKKDVLLDVLEKLGERNLSHKSINELSSMVRRRLEKGDFLMCLDDVWTVAAWKEIMEFLPDKSKKLCKVLITTRDRQVAKHASTGDPHELRFLDDNESWELICSQVFGKLDDCPPELEDIGKLIAQDCKGLPFKIVMIGGLLYDKWKVADRPTEAREEWLKISKMVKTCLGCDDGLGGDELRKTISLSYNTLSSSQKDCLLYLGSFPDGTEIRIWDLLQLWIAEGFIHSSEGRSLEESANECLKDLISKNLLMVGRTKPDGEIQTCRVHNSIHTFCKKEAAMKEEILFNEVKLSEEGDFVPEVDEIKKCRRLCAHAHVKEFLLAMMKKADILNARSFICFSKENLIFEKKHMPSFSVFKLVRVLYVNASTKFPEFPVKLDRLKFVSFSCDDLKVLPKKLSKFCDLRTIQVYTSCPTINFKANIWKMENLVHIMTKAAIILTNVDGKGDGGENLRTIKTLSPQSCTSKVLCRTNNLQELGIRGSLVDLFRSMSCLHLLVRLIKLKVVNESPPEEAKLRPLPCLPPPYKFPPSLRALTLSGTLLNWADMHVLAQLATLSVLKLKRQAFKGEDWDATSYTFDNLITLCISDTDLRNWTASSENFPRLSCATLKNCEQLEKVPDELVKKLHLLYMDGASSYAASCAREIEMERQQMQGDRQAKKGRFKLTIIPQKDDNEFKFGSDNTN